MSDSAKHLTLKVFNLGACLSALSNRNGHKKEVFKSFAELEPELEKYNIGIVGVVIHVINITWPLPLWGPIFHFL